MALKTNVTGTTSLTTTLLAAGDKVNDIKSILITNTHASADAVVDLYMDNNVDGSFYMIKNVTIPFGVSLVLTDNVKIDNSLTGFNLYIKVGASSSTLDVLIKNQK
tara:strand:+ start:831 stop:1148 length:318 start_codon:yes stop_codon:yes gene_type:complete